jgi:surface antigen Omp85-like protein
MRTAALLLCVLILPLQAAAQDTQTPTDTPGDLGNLPVPAWGQAIVDSFSRPVHPVVGGVASGGGLGFGVGYDSPDDSRWYQEAEAMMTVRRFWSLDGEVGRRSLSKRSQVAAFGTVRHMGRLDYFGLGPHSSFDDRAMFRLRETTFGTRGWFRVTPAVRVGGSVAAYMPDLGRGTSPTVRSIEEVFTPTSAPGFDAEPMFGRYRGFVELVHPTRDQPDTFDDSDNNRGVYQLAFEAVRDLESGTHDFHRWETEVQQRIPGLRPGQRLTLHGFLASTNTGADIPFYMMYTLGGAGGLKSFRPDLLGTDGTRATLRGFRSYRFRDRNLVLMQAEYRIPVHKYIHTTVFVDAGQVAPKTSELFKDLRASTGFSIGYVRKGRTVGRMDIGFGGGEGIHLSWTFGAFQD